MGPSVGLIAMQADDEQLDDWLGTISDDDWDEGAIARAGLRRAMPADQEPADAEDDARRDAASDRAAADDHHAKVVWRRRVAALASLAVLVLAVVVGVLLLRGGDERPVPPVDGTGDTTSTPTETVEAPTTTTPSTTTPTTTTPSTTPDSAAFSLPEGTKLQSEDAEPSAASDLEVSTDPELVTALGRLDGIPVGILANQSLHQAGAIGSDASVKAADFLDLCERWRLPVVSLVDTPGFMVGPDAERTGLVRHASRMVTSGAQLTVPLVGVILRRAYGLGAQAMLGGSTHRPLLTVAWPTAHLGAMGLEGAVRLALARELAELPEGEREETVRRHTSDLRDHAAALNAARVFEIDDVIDPAETRSVVAATLRAAGRA